MATLRPQTVLLTGFEPFGGDPVNPSWEVAQRLHGQVLQAADGRTARVVAVQLPCVFHQALQVLDAALASHRPALVLALGLAANRVDISLERVAVNVDDARIPDNAGAQPIDQPVLPGQVSAQGLPGLALGEQLRAVLLALQVMLDTGEDLKASGGAVA